MGTRWPQYVQATRCGCVVQGVDQASLGQAIRELRRNYGVYRAHATEVGKRDFSQEALVSAYRDLYCGLVG